MGKLKIIHTADLHLGSSFSILPPEKALQRRAELLEMPEKIMRLAENETADAVLISGDLFDSTMPDKDAVNAFLSAVGQSEIPVFISPGNHDYYCASSVYAKTVFPSNVFLFTRNEVEYYDFSDRGFRVYGAAFQSEFSRPLLEGVSVEKTDGVTDIMCLHGEVCRGESSYSKITPVQIAQSNLDYLALGHLHRMTELRKAGKTYYAYPGCPEGRGFDEIGLKTVSILESDGSFWKVKTVELASRRVEEVKLDISGRDPVTAISEIISPQQERDIWSITLYGLTDCRCDSASILSRIGDGFFALKITDLTQRLEDVFNQACTTTLRGVFIGKIRDLYNTAGTEKDRTLAVNALRWGLAAFDGGPEAVQHDN